MRRFKVWLDVQIPGVESVVELVEMPASATDEECEKACEECLNILISNELDTGWDEET